MNTTRGKLLWHKLKIEKIEEGNSSVSDIHIHIPIELYVPYEASDDDTAQLIRDAVFNKLIDLNWARVNIDNLYYTYYPTYFYVKILTDNGHVVSFYKRLKIHIDNKKYMKRIKVSGVLERLNLGNCKD